MRLYIWGISKGKENRSNSVNKKVKDKKGREKDGRVEGGKVRWGGDLLE